MLLRTSFTKGGLGGFNVQLLDHWQQPKVVGVGRPHTHDWKKKTGQVTCTTIERITHPS